LLSSTDVRERVACGLVTAGFTDHRALDAAALIPRRLWAPFSCVRRHASRSPWTTNGGITPYHQLHQLRSLVPPTSPFASTRVAPGLRPMLSWISVPSRDQASQTSEPQPVPPLTEQAHARTCDLGEQHPPRPGETSPARERPGSTSSAGTRNLSARPAPPLGGDSFSPDLSTPVARCSGLRSF
jgi:hypothetical protein